MRSERIEDRVQWGMNIAARTMGETTSAYRPHGADHPLSPDNRFLSLYAAFSSLDGMFKRTPSYGDPLCRGIFDAKYTQPGDYLVQQDAIWFIAAQAHLLPTLCVRTNCIVSFARPASQATAGINPYGGITQANQTPLMTSWPASVLVSARQARAHPPLPADTAVSVWTVLLPACPSVILRTADLMSDDLGRNGVVATSELTELGWRLSVRQATT